MYSIFLFYAVYILTTGQTQIIKTKINSGTVKTKEKSKDWVTLRKYYVGRLKAIALMVNPS